MKDYFTGFVRIIEYADYAKEGDAPSYAFKLIEGQIEKGKPHGLARVIDGFSKTL